MEREASFPEPMVYSLINSFVISVRVPNTEPSHEKGENIWSPSMEPRVNGRPTYNGVWPGSPRYYYPYIFMIQFF
jgi:hypothetical protein